MYTLTYSIQYLYWISHKELECILEITPKSKHLLREVNNHDDTAYQYQST